jgi:hypothetical protein
VCRNIKEGREMPNYVTRVELRGSPTGEHYQSLHNAMEAKGFSRTIKSDDGTAYHMPHAMYYVVSSLTASEVSEHANAAATSVWTSCRVFSCEAPNSAWIGLEIA